MGVYINMEMPTAPVLFCIHPDGKVFADLEGGWREYKAIPVPKHGRLIDADALIKELEITEEDDHNGATLLMAVFLEVLKSAPTIIQASKEVNK